MYKFSDEETQNIIERYAKGESSVIIGNSFGCSYPVILRCLQNQGLLLKKTRDRIAKEHEQDILTLYDSGKNSDEVGRVFGYSGDTVKRIVREAGKLRKCGNQIQPIDENSICTEYLNGYNPKYIGKRYGRTDESIRDILKRNSIDLRGVQDVNRKYHFDEHFFDNVDTEDKAYFLGLLYADGCVQSDRSRITLFLQKRDIDILEKFKKCLQHTKRLKYTKAKDFKGLPYVSQPQFGLVIDSRIMHTALLKLGCIPRKSLILTFPSETSVPKYLYQHFIRGYFDGDGCIYLSKDKKRVAFELVGTRDFMTGIQTILIQSIGLSQTKLKQQNKIYYLVYGGRNECLKIRNYLYQDATVYLNRKYNKFFDLEKY